MIPPALAVAVAATASAALALALRVDGIADHSLWFDEALEYGRAVLPLSLLVAGRSIDHDPPLMSLLLRAWLGAGDGEGWLRLPSALAGAATAATVAGWGIARLGRWTGVLAGVAMAGAPVLVLYGQELNQYAGSALLATWLLASHVRVADRGRGWAAHAVLCSLALAWHYGMAFPVAASVALLGVEAAGTRDGAARRRWWRLTVVLGAVVGLLAVLGLGDAIAVPHLQRRLGGTSIEKELDYIRDVGWRDVLVYYTLPGSGGPALAAVRLLAVGAAFGAARLWRGRRAGRQVLGLGFLAPLSLSYLASTLGWYPLGYRYGLFAAPALLIGIAAAVAAPAEILRARRPPVRAVGAATSLSAALAVAALFAAFRPQADEANRWMALPREDLGPVATHIARAWRPGDTLYAAYGSVPAMRYYWRRRGPFIEGGALNGAGTGREAARIREAAALGGRVWLVVSHDATGEEARLLRELLTWPDGSSLLRVVGHARSAGATGYALERH